MHLLKFGRIDKTRITVVIAAIMMATILVLLVVSPADNVIVQARKQSGCFKAI